MIVTFMFLNERHAAPREDALACDPARGILVATDGVTRDWDAIRAAGYPDPSPATGAADASADALLHALGDGAGMADAMVRANEAVHRVNADLCLHERCDYLEYDLAGAVAAAARVRGDRLEIGWIGDCGVAVIRDGKLFYLTRDQLDPVSGFLRARPAPFDDARRVYIRRDLRNKPGLIHEGRDVTYGVLTGEPEALAYPESDTVALQPGDVVSVHTDGFRPYFQHPDFLALLSGDPARWQPEMADLCARLIAVSPEYGRERSTLLYKHPL